MLESIMSCKLYKASTHKDKIIPIVCNLLGSELVQQLSTYIDDDRVVSKEEYDAMVSDTADDVDTLEDDFDENSEESEGSGSPSNPSKLGGSPAHFTPSSGPEDAGSSDNESDSDEPTEDVAESKRVSGRSIIRSSYEFTISTARLQEIVDEIKGTLNFRQETQGVCRVLLKENELWIYYNDDINLNNVVDAVIELLAASGYSYLSFNRLARSDNSIVFEANLADTRSGIGAIADAKSK